MSLLTGPPVGGTPHQAQQTSTGTGDPKTVTKQENSRSMMISVTTTDARVRFDGTDPDATHGIVLAAGGVYFFPFASDVHFAATSGANSLVNVLYLT